MGNRTNDKPGVFRPPQCGQIVRAVVRAMGLGGDVFSSRTARRYYSRVRTHEEAGQEILKELAFALIESKVIPLPVSSASKEKYQELLSLAIQRCAIRWDQIAGYIRSVSFPVTKKDLAPLPYLRLAVIDLSLRVAGMLRINGIQSIPEELPVWAEPEGNRRLLKGLLESMGDRRLTREDVAKHLNVYDNRVDSWIDAGVRPQDKYLCKLADELADSTVDGSVEQMVGKLRRHYTLSALCDVLAEHIGRPAVMDLASALVLFTNRLLLFLNGLNKRPAQGDVLILALGTEFEQSAGLLEHLWRIEKDPVWRVDLPAASGDWVPRLQNTAQLLGSLDGALQEFQKRFNVSDEVIGEMSGGIERLIQADLTRAVPGNDERTWVRIKGDAAFSARNRMTAAMQAVTEGDLDSAITHLRRAVDLQPQSAEYHFHLGATLGKRRVIEEGIQECWIAAKLDPKWDLPLVEVGIILINSGQNKAALEHLETAAKAFPEITAHLAANLGFARMRCGAPNRALEMFDVVLNELPDNGLVLDCAAHCYFLTGNGQKGRELAKKAYLVGFTDTYNDWRAGKYRKRQ